MADEPNDDRFTPMVNAGDPPNFGEPIPGSSTPMHDVDVTRRIARSSRS